MDTNANKATTRRVFEEGFNQGRLEVVDQCLAAEAVDQHLAGEPEHDFRSHLKETITVLRAAFPDLCMHVEDIIAEGDRVAARVVMTGTHTGVPLWGREATGIAVSVEQFHIIAYDDDGRGRHHWANPGVERLMATLTGAAA